MAAESQPEDAKTKLDEASTLHEHALNYIMQGEYSEAEKAHRQALALREGVLGPDAHDVAISLNYLAYLLCVRKEYAAAEPLYRRSLAIRERLFADHSAVVTALRNLAELLGVRGRLEEAVLACTVFLLASALVERHGPWPALLGFLACTTAASGGLAALLARRATTTELRFGAAYCALTFFFNGVWPVLYVVTPAAFPTDARGAGFGAANVGKQLGAVALPLVAGALLHRSLLALGLVLTGGWLLGAAAAAVQARRPAYLARGGEEERADGVDADSPLV